MEEWTTARIAKDHRFRVGVLKERETKIMLECVRNTTTETALAGF